MKKVVLLVILLGLAAIGAKAQSKVSGTQEIIKQLFADNAKYKLGQYGLYSNGKEVTTVQPNSDKPEFFRFDGKDNYLYQTGTNDGDFRSKSKIAGNYIYLDNPHVLDKTHSPATYKPTNLQRPKWIKIVYAYKDKYGNINKLFTVDNNGTYRYLDYSGKDKTTISTTKSLTQQKNANNNTSVSRQTQTNITAPKAEFEKIWLEHNVMQNGEKGMKIHVKTTVLNMKGKKCMAVAFFDCPKGVGVPDRNGKYCNSEGKVCATTDITPGYDNTIYNDLVIFIPNNEIHFLPGKKTYYTRVFIQGPNGMIPGNSDFVNFSATGSDNNPVVSNKKNNSPTVKNGSTKTWREELGYGMFAINIEYTSGLRSRTIWRLCSVCRGSKLCGNCYGTKLCTICGGNGHIISAGYGTYIPCAACGFTGRCGICHGSGLCICSKFDYPGYQPGSTITLGPDGKEIYNSRTPNSNNSFVGNSSNSSSGFHSPSNNSSSNKKDKRKCVACGGSGKCENWNLGSVTLSGQYCSGSGKCSNCNGKGYVQSTYTTGYMDCTYCNSTGNCGKCGGTGRCRVCGGSGER